MDDEYAQDTDIIQRYISVCNAALFKNSMRFPFKQILAAAEKSSSGRLIEMEIIDWPQAAGYIIGFSEGRIHVNKHKECKVCECEGTWSVSKSYIYSVVENPPIYIENPALLDWDWLYKS